MIVQLANSLLQAWESHILRIVVCFLAVSIPIQLPGCGPGKVPQMAQSLGTLARVWETLNKLLASAPTIIGT